MIFENEIFVIKYSESDLEYLELIIERLNTKYKEYMRFFDINKLPQKINFIIYNNLELFKEKMLTSYNLVKENIVGHAHGNLVEILTLRERKKIEIHKNSNEETIVMTCAHELLHIFHAFYKGNNKNSWFAEGLAINLGSPRYELSLIDCTPDDLIHKKGKSRHYFAMVKYMLENMPHENVLEFAKNDDLVIKHTEKIYKLANEWIKNSNKNIVNKVSLFKRI